MLTIRPIEEKSRQEELCKLCDAVYKADDLAYSCYEGDRFVGVCQFLLKDGKALLHDISLAVGTEDFGAQFIMGRAALNFADLAGFHDAYYIDPVDTVLAERIGFKNNVNGEWYFDLRGFFESPCSCDKK